MPIVYADRVQETTLTAGTGTVALAGAVAGFQTFLAGIGLGNQSYYAITETATGAWEVGIGTLGVGTFSRDSVLSSSNTNALVVFLAGAKEIFSVSPATFYAGALTTTAHSTTNHAGIPGVPAAEAFTALVHAVTNHAGITGVGNLATAPGTGVVDHSTLNHTGIPGTGSTVGGSGVDGPLTVLTGTVVEITGPKNYTTLTIQGNGILTTVAGRVLDVKAQTCDIQSVGKISGTGRGPAGGSGGAGSLGVAGGQNSGSGQAGSLGGNNSLSAVGHSSAAGGGGGAGAGGCGNFNPSTSGNGGAGGNGRPRSLAIDGLGGGIGGVGGIGVSFGGTGGSGSAGTAATTLAANPRQLLSDLIRTSGLSLIYGGAGGSGGGGGSGAAAFGGAGTVGAGGTPGSQTGSGFGVGNAGGSPSNSVNGSGGGAGGAGGANVFCGFGTLTMAVGARIESNGANGGAGTGGNPGGSGGGGSGGGAGLLCVKYSTGTNVDTTRCVAIGGLGGAGGVGSGQAGSGAAGNSGEDGIVIIQQV